MKTALAVRRLLTSEHWMTHGARVKLPREIGSGNRNTGSWTRFLSVWLHIDGKDESVLSLTHSNVDIIE